MNQPVYDIDPKAFTADPYPDLARMREHAPICFVPQLNAVLMTKRGDIYTCEKKIDVFSSEQPGGLMDVLMGQNMMRKNGAPHQLERRQAFPALSPRTVRDVWEARFKAHSERVLQGLKDRDQFDLVRDFAMPVSAHALREITGLTNLTPTQMDTVSQAMIDGIANYAGIQAVEARCNAATAQIDAAIDEMLRIGPDPHSLLAVLIEAQQDMASVRANVKLAISGGQNEPRDAIAGAAWALLCHPDQLQLVTQGLASWRQVFEEYARWISPIGMSPRRIAATSEWGGVPLFQDQRVFFMFSSANRDEDIFANPDQFDVNRDTGPAIAFGAGPHFCAGAAASRVLIADVALPMLFEAFPALSLCGEAPFSGWAFRGPVIVPVRTTAA